MFPSDSKILIVDDSNFARSTLKNGLNHLKFTRILEASDVEEGQLLLMNDEQVRHPVHLIITDLAMPHKSGIDFLRWIRTQERLKHTPVIVLSNSQDKSGILEAGKLGVCHYMVKPFDNATLKDKLASTWTRQGKKFHESLKGP